MNAHWRAPAGLHVALPLRVTAVPTVSGLAGLALAESVAHVPLVPPVAWRTYESVFVASSSALEPWASVSTSMP